MNNKFQSEFNKRQYMISKNFELYYYNNSHLDYIEFHCHTYYELYFFIEGNLTLFIENESYILKPYDIVIIPPNIHHKAHINTNKGKYRRFVFWITTDYINSLNEISNKYNYIFDIIEKTSQYIFSNDLITFNSIQSKLLNILEEINSNRYGNYEFINLNIMNLILYLNRIFYEKFNKEHKSETQTIYENINTYIEENISNNLTLDIISKKFFLNKYYLSHIFKDSMGISLYQFIIKKRLEACKNAILENNNISKVYIMFGFKDYSSFYRAFKKEYGISPTQYINNSKKIIVFEDKN